MATVVASAYAGRVAADGAQGSSGIIVAKSALYAEVYDPLAAAWFSALAAADGTRWLLAEAASHTLLDNLDRANALFHDLVDRSLDELGERRDRILAVVREHSAHVLWEGQQVPAPGATSLAAYLLPLRHKLKRNISLGAVEAVICLESGLRYCRSEPRLARHDPLDVLGRSRQLYGSLAYLHDEQEMTRLEHLTGVPGYLRYPEVGFREVIVEGAYAIPPQRFRTVTGGGPPRIRFARLPAHRAPLTGPTLRCPAQRIKPETGGDVLNDVLWDLLVELYRRSRA
jgi:hypothetical protein